MKKWTKPIIKIEEHYNTQAKKHSRSPKSTMPDLFIRKMEITKIIEAIKIIINSKNEKKIIKEFNVLDFGCGNGYTLNQVRKIPNCEFTGVDSNKKMIKVATNRKLKNIKFTIGSVTNSKIKDNLFDIVYTERCLINLPTWDLQKKGLNEIHRILKKRGCYVMLESFTDGFSELNKARKALHLDKINPAWHNVIFNKKEFEKYIRRKFKDFQTNSIKKFTYDNFLSSYYFGSRILYPSLIKNQEIVYNNKFVEFFSHIQPFGNYSPLQVIILEKIE